MKISEQWLREWVSPDINTEALVEQLTMAGLEVDGTEQVAGPFNGVVVGEIVSLEHFIVSYRPSGDGGHSSRITRTNRR